MSTSYDAQSMPLSSEETHVYVEEIEAVLLFAEEVSNNIRTLNALAANLKRQFVISFALFIPLYISASGLLFLGVSDKIGEMMVSILFIGLSLLGFTCAMFGYTQFRAWRQVSADLEAEQRVMKDLITLASPLIEGLNSDARFVWQALLHMRFRRLSFSGEKYG